VLKNRPDFSSYLAHFTSDREPLGLKDANNPANGFARLIAGQRLGSILRSQVIRASTMPWTNRRAVCFTECPWSSLLDHANQYSPFGVGFEKPHVFAGGVGQYITFEPIILRNSDGSRICTLLSRRFGRNIGLVELTSQDTRAEPSTTRTNANGACRTISPLS